MEALPPVNTVLGTVGEELPNGPPGAPGLLGRPETGLGSSDLKQCSAHDMMGGANSVCGLGISRDSWGRRDSEWVSERSVSCPNSHSYQDGIRL